MQTWKARWILTANTGMDQTNRFLGQKQHQLKLHHLSNLLLFLQHFLINMLSFEI